MSGAEVPQDEAALAPQLSHLLAADSVSGVLIFLAQDAIVDDPDARLLALGEVFAHIHALPATDAAAPSPPPLHGPRWRWADVVMRGVTDPWSRIRSLAAPVMADLLTAEVELVQRRRRHGFGSCNSSAAPTPSSGTPRSSSATAATTPRGVRKGRKGEPQAAAASASPESVSGPLDYVWRRWRGTTLWYEQDGIVRVLAKLYNRSGTPAGDALRTDEAGLRCLLLNIVFPALRNPQLPVRESAAVVLGILADRRRRTSLSPAITCFVVDHVCRTLAQVPAPVRSGAQATSVVLEDTRVLEGNLLALNELVDAGVMDAESFDVIPLLLRLSSYPASSVRQYVAQILRPPSPSVFAYLMQRLCEHHNCMPRHADGDGDDDGDVELSWQRLETVMMALQQHLLYLHSTSAPMDDGFPVSCDTRGILTPAIFATSLSVVFQATHSPRFEVARMGLQLFPLLQQLSFRFGPLAALPRICETCCGVSGCVQAELNRLAASGDAATLARAQTYVATYVVPAMWWFLTIRRLVAEVRHEQQPVETRAQVEDAVRPYATLEQVRFASQPHLGGDGGGGDDVVVVVPPCAASTCALLPLVTYSAGVMDAEEWHRCVDVLLVPSWWAGLLTDPARRELARIGPDFVRAVHRRGTGDEMRRVVELVPTLTAALAAAPTHQQCLLVAMIRVAVVAHTASTAAAEERALAFVYHAAYAAPALVEGGDAVPLGHVWLKQVMPTQEAVPTAVLWGEPAAEMTGESMVLVESNSAVFEALERTCYRQLYRSPQTEPVVLRELRTLMVSLSRPSAGVPSGTYADSYAAALAAVFGRLERVCPGWWETEDAAAATAAAATADASRCDDDECWDDWDADADEDGAAQGIYAAEEMRNAAAVVSVLRERAGLWMAARDQAAAEDRYRTELTVLASA